jgi:hypothetical protein
MHTLKRSDIAVVLISLIVAALLYKFVVAVLTFVLQIAVFLVLALVIASGVSELFSKIRRRRRK